MAREFRATTNAPLYDGTPRRERGVRPYIDDMKPNGSTTAILVGPLLRSQDHAERWFAVVDEFLSDGRDWPAAAAAWRRFAARHGFPVAD